MVSFPKLIVFCTLLSTTFYILADTILRSLTPTQRASLDYFYSSYDLAFPISILATFLWAVYWRFGTIFKAISILYIVEFLSDIAEGLLTKAMIANVEAGLGIEFLAVNTGLLVTPLKFGTLFAGILSLFVLPFMSVKSKSKIN